MDSQTGGKIYNVLMLIAAAKAKKLTRLELKHRGISFMFVNIICHLGLADPRTVDLVEVELSVKS